MRREEHTDYDAGLAAEVLRQQQIHHIQRIPTIAHTSAFNGLIVVIVFWGKTSSVLLLTWYAVVVAAAACQLLGWGRISRRPPPARVTGRSLERAKYWSAFVGAIWSSAAYMFYTPDSVPLQFFLAVVIAGIAAGTVALLSPIPKLNLWFLSALLGPFSVRFLLEGDKLHLVVVGLSTAYGLALMHSSWESYNTLVKLVRSHKRLEKARSDLEDAIESTNDAFALFDDKRRLVTANSRFRDWFEGAQKVRGGDAKGRLQQLEGGRWVVSTVRPTSRGGWVSVHVDVSALKQREEELLAAKQHAEDADRAKTQFLANMSHELRTPLNAIIGFSQMLRDQVFGSLGDARYRTYAEDIYDSGRHLLSIINDILDISKIECSRNELKLERIDLRETVDWCVAMCRARDENGARRRVVVEIDGEAGWLEADRRGLKQILINLLANALKFTPVEKPVGVRARAVEGGGVAIAVWDEGIGIAADKIAEVRKPFFQVENSLAKRFNGAGLGLAIVDALARSHGGKLEIESVEGQGSTFTVSFPPGRVEPPVHATHAARPRGRTDVSVDAPAPP